VGQFPICSILLIERFYRSADKFVQKMGITMRITKETIYQWISEGRGQGHGSEYIPWIKITRRRSPSGGHLEFEHVPLLNRHFHLLSKNELLVALLLLWLGVEDLRDQFPCWPWAHPHPLYKHPLFKPETLPWSEGSIVCAQSIGVKHPRYPNTKINYIPTIDLMATRRILGTVSAVAFAVKPEESEVPLNNDDLEKLAITTEYCSRLSIPWKLVSGTLIPSTFATNLCTLLPYSDKLNRGLENEWLEFIDILNCNLSQNISIHESLTKVEIATGLTRPNVLTLFRRALWFRKTNIDLRHAIVMSIPPTLSDQAWVNETTTYMLG
jgi:hypothetical protein